MPSDTKGQPTKENKGQLTGSRDNFPIQNVEEDEKSTSGTSLLGNRSYTGSDKVIQIYTDLDSEDDAEETLFRPEMGRHDSFTFTYAPFPPNSLPPLPAQPSSSSHPASDERNLHSQDPRLHRHFRLMADEIIDCYTPEETRQINRNDYVQLSGRRFFTWSGTLIVSGYLFLMLGSAFLFTYVEHVNKESKELHDMQFKFLRAYPNVDGN